MTKYSSLVHPLNSLNVKLDHRSGLSKFTSLELDFKEPTKGSGSQFEGGQTKNRTPIDCIYVFSSETTLDVIFLILHLNHEHG